jgi:hypothetical protein
VVVLLEVVVVVALIGLCTLSGPDASQDGLLLFCWLLYAEVVVGIQEFDGFENALT